MVSADGFPWDESPEFDAIMQRYERNHPAGPGATIIRRLIMWRLYNEPPWTVPDDPLDAKDWLR